MSRKTRKLIWSAPLVAALAVAGVLAMFVALEPGSVFANSLPNAPSNLVAEAAADAAGRTTLVLDWDAPAGGNVSGYRIDMSNRGAIWETLTMDTGSTTTTYTDDTLTAEDTRWYRVFAVNSHGVGSVSNAASGTTDKKVNPGSVMNLRATPNAKDSYHHIDLSWDPPAENGGEMIVGYEVQYFAVTEWRPIGSAASGDDNNVTLTDKTKVTDMSTGDALLDPGDTRMYRVRAMNGTEKITPNTNTVAAAAAGDVSKKWADVNGTTRAASAPGQVTGLTAVNADGTTIQLYWYDPEDTGGFAITGYLIQARRDGKKFLSIPKDDDLEIVTTIITTELGTGATLDNSNQFVAKRVAGVLQAPFETALVDHDGDAGEATPTPVRQVKWDFRVFALTFDNGKNEATDPAGLEDDVIRRSGSPSNVASDVAAVRTIDHDDDGDTDALDPLAKPGIVATPGSDTKKPQIDLNLTLDPSLVDTTTTPDTVRAPQIAYRIDYSKDAGLTWKLLEDDTRFTRFGPDRPYEDDDGLGFDELRSYRVFAIGRHPYTDVGLPSDIQTGMTPASEAPGKPTGVTASAPSLRSIQVSLTAPEDNGGQAIVKYLYQYAKDDGDTVPDSEDWAVANDPVADKTDDAATTFTIEIPSTGTALEPEELYHIRIAGVNTDPASTPNANAERPVDEDATDDPPSGLRPSASTPAKRPSRMRWKG